MKGSKQALRATQMVRLLVQRATGLDQADEGFDPLLSYVHRLMNSLTSMPRLQDKFEIQRKILASVNNGKTVEANRQTAVRLGDLFEQLLQRPLKNTWAILYVLYKLSDTNEATQQPLIYFPQRADFNSAKKSSVLASKASSSNESSKASKGAEKTSGKSTIRTDDRKEYLDQEKIVRDIIFVLQGIDGQFVKFDKSEGSFKISEKVSATPPKRRLLNLICEGGWLYLKIQGYLKAATETTISGLVEQSFCGSLQGEITHYFHQIAALESELMSKNTGKLTLRGVYLWSMKLVENLRIMAMMVDSAKQSKGGALISCILKYLQHGDPAVAGFVRSILQRCCVPLFKMIAQWMSAAELKDPFQEFFVVARQSIPVDKLWQERYVLNKEMIPAFMSRKLASKILNVGKSINFIQNCCRGSKADQAGKEDSQEVTVADLHVEGLNKLNFDDVDIAGVGAGTGEKKVFGGLEGVVQRTATVVNSRLMDIMIRRFGVRKHCLAMKKYLLLGQGDFVTRLLDLLSVELEEPAAKVFRHNLVLVLKAAIQQSNAQYEDPDVLNRLDVRLLKPIRRDSGWDVFSLDYHVGLPLNVVLTPPAIDRYLRVFRLLWRLRRVEHSLAKCWSMQTTHASRLQMRRHYRKVDAYDDERSDTDSLITVFRKGYLLRNEMAHFISNLTSYMMFEVLECAWAEFEVELAKVQDLDGLIAAHERYLSQIIAGAFMESEASKSDVLSKQGIPGDKKHEERNTRKFSSEGKISPIVELNKMFDIILEFVRLQEHVYEEAALDLNMREQEDIRRYKRLNKKKWTDTKSTRPKGKRMSRKTTEKVQERLESLEVTFSSLLASLRSRLGQSTDSAVQLLDVRLDFNEFYDEKRRRQLGSAESQ